MEKKERINCDADVCTTKVNYTAFARQLFTITAPITGLLLNGLTTGSTATNFPQLEQSPDFKLTEDFKSWIGKHNEHHFLEFTLAGSIILNCVLATTVNGFVTRKYGRKPSEIFSFVIWIVGFSCCAFSHNNETLILGYSFLGLGLGVHMSIGPVYIAEIADPRHRSFLSGLGSVFCSTGIFLGHLLGILFPWRIALGISAVIPLAAFLIMLFAPETPNWLFLNGNYDKATKIFLWLRNNSTSCVNELYNLQTKRIESSICRKKTVFKNIFSKSLWKPFLILFIMNLVQQGSGMYVVIFYSLKFCSKISLNVRAETFTIIIDIMRLIGSVTVCALAPYFNRRFLFFTSASGVFVSLIGLICTSLYNLSGIVAAIFLSTYIWFLYIGLSPIPFWTTGEIFPITVREAGSSLTTISLNLVGFILVKTEPFVTEKYGMVTTLSEYAAIVLLGSLLLYIYMPETNNETLQKIEDDILKKSKQSMKFVNEVESLTTEKQRSLDKI